MCCACNWWCLKNHVRIVTIDVLFVHSSRLARKRCFVVIVGANLREALLLPQTCVVFYACTAKIKMFLMWR